MVAHYGTVTAAAHAMHLTPSAASLQIRELSRSLGIPLLRPEGRGVRLTPGACALLEHADELEARWEEAQADLAAYAEGEGDPRPLRLCGFPSAVAALLVPAAVRLRTACPRLPVHIIEAESPESFDLLFAGDADLAVVNVTPAIPALSDRRFSQQPLLDEPLDLLVPVGHQLAGQASVQLSDAAGERWVISRQGTEHHDLTVIACTAAGFAPEVAHRAREWFAVSSLVAAGFGVALMPRLGCIPPEHKVVRVPLHGSPVPSRRIMTAVRCGSREYPSIKETVDALTEIAGRFCA
jgi:DNA-binding transcriptional LysR family regulator